MIIVGETLAALDLPLALQVPLNGYADVFLKWNRRINLSSARDEDELQDHVVDCLHLVPHLRAVAALQRGGPGFLDVGAGGGLPSAIAAICMPEAHITALEPVHKKHAFLRTLARELGLANFEPRAERLDDHARSDYAAATSRATFDLRDWLLRGVSRVRPGGLVFGFEAVPRDDLPSGTRRYPYAHRQKSRAIVSYERPL